MELKKFDDELQIVYGEVYAPGVVDSQGDYMDEDGVRAMAHRFLANMRTNNIDTNHSHELVDAVVVESFIARGDDPVFIGGAWVAGVHIPDPALWDRVKKGEFNGFSFDGAALRQKVEVEIEVPEYVSGSTDVVEGHSHGFKVFFDEDGNFLGGKTEDAEEHYHEIVKGTVTNSSGSGHRHKFSFVEELAHVQETA